MYRETLFRLLHAQYLEGHLELDELNDWARDCEVDSDAISRYYMSRLGSSPLPRRHPVDPSCAHCAKATLVRSFLDGVVNVKELVGWAGELGLPRHDVVQALETCAEAAYGSGLSGCFHGPSSVGTRRSDVSCVRHRLAADS